MFNMSFKIHEDIVFTDKYYLSRIVRATSSKCKPNAHPLVHQTGAGSDSPDYSDPAMHGRCEGEVPCKNVNDPCIHDKKLMKKRKYYAWYRKSCAIKDESMRNPGIRFGGLTLTGVRTKIQSPVA